MNQETNVYRPRRTVDITTTPVDHATGSGWVNKPSWEPTAGKRRQEQIEEARLQAVADYEQKLADSHPHAQRITALEAQVISLASQLSELNAQFTKVLTSGKK